MATNVTSAAEKLKKIQGGLSLQDVAKLSESLRKEKNQAVSGAVAKEAESAVSQLSALKKTITPVVAALGGGTAAAALTISSLNWSKLPKILLYLAIIAAGVFSTLNFGLWAGALFFGVLVLVFALKSEKIFSFFSTILTFVFFTALLIIAPLALGVFAKMPAWLLLTVEIVLFFMVFSVNKNAGYLALLVIIVFVPWLHYYATEVVPQDSALAEAVFAAEEQFGGIKNFSPKNIVEYFSNIAKISVAEATGDYYSSNVDSNAKKKLGVFIEDIVSTQKPAVFVAGQPLTFYTKIKAQSLDFDFGMKLSCEFASENVVKGVMVPDTIDFVKQELAGEGDAFDFTDADCVLSDSSKLLPGRHTVSIVGSFNFATRSYLSAYFIDRGKKRELERRSLWNEWISGLPSNAFNPIHTSGPIKIGLNAGSQPVPISSKDKEGPTVSITIEKAVDGYVKSVNSILLMLPKGLSLKDVNGDVGNAVKVTCFDLDETEQKGCDDAYTNIYKVDTEKVIGAFDVSAGKSVYNFVTFRAHTLIDDYNALMGSGATILPKKIKATALYDYELRKDADFSIRAVKT